MNKIAVLGTGNMGHAIVKGLIQSKSYRSKDIYATRRNVNKLNDLKLLGVNITSDNIKAVKESNWIIVAVKPHLIINLLEEIKPILTEKHVIISIATGISITEIESVIGNKPKIYRAMPNTATSVSEGITCICTSEEHKDTAHTVEALFSHLGETLFIEEKLMDAATVIGACGVAYALRFMRAMMQGAIEIGFDSTTASKLISQMVKGSASMLIENGTHPEQEIDKVMTPMGCTITGLNEMEHQGFSSALIKGIVASYKKIEK